ncbi:hypothetical protein BH09DEP1_BH09DEP1_2570 [soil metagenome]
MILLLLFVFWSSCGIAMQLESSERIIGHELSEKDKNALIEIDHKNKLQESETVAIQQKGAWRYARVQSIPTRDCPGLGIVNLRPACPEKDTDYNNYGGFVLHFKHVRKLHCVENVKVQKTE